MQFRVSAAEVRLAGISETDIQTRDEPVVWDHSGLKLCGAFNSWSWALQVQAKAM